MVQYGQSSDSQPISSSQEKNLPLVTVKYQGS